MAHLPQLYLASQSPRRAALLQQMGVEYEVLSVTVDETVAATETPDNYARRLALEKARAGWSALPPERQRPVLGADTIVIAADTVMGKPADRQQAIAMLLALSGTSHQVITAVALAAGHESVCSQCSQVTFRTLTRRECEAYWESGEPRDKAGAYAIQGLAAMFITRLDGSYSGVMGLPLYETAELLKSFGIVIL
ncbi:MAG: Maf family protein [Gammaproteobacteria bacterium]|jgi:septum formation protein